MLIPIVFPSAGAIWLNFDVQNIGNKLLRTTDLPAQYDLLSDKEIIQELLAKYDLPAPLKLLSPNAAARRDNKLISCIARAKGYPASAFLELESFRAESGDVCRVLLASPELCFLQAASQLSFYETIKFGYDLCAMYRLDGFAEYGQRTRIPATSVRSITRFLDRAGKIYGVAEARHAVKYILDCSNSPMETMLAILETLSFYQGGFSINGQELNKEIFLSERAASVVGRKSVTCDAVWMNERLVLEYDSNETHLTANQHDWDKRKATALAIDGFRVFPVTAGMIRSCSEIEKTFVALRKLLGKRTDPRQLAAGREKRRELIHFLRGF
ncbi:MAG: hypothetical protein IJJ17_03335 [Parasporobacterium sp.]|nr:hypothetical protein [Parasporobacterium sp.]